MPIVTNRRQALAGLLATPFASACATTAPPIDGTYLEGGDDNFNNPNNWSSKAVPTGTATIALTKRISSINVTADWTLGAIRLAGFAPLVVPAGRSLTLNGAGLDISNAGSALIDGSVTGPVVVGQYDLRGRGTVNGNVTCARGSLVPGGFEQTSYGTITINGSYTQTDTFLVLRLVGPNLSRVEVTNAAGGSGRAVLAGNAGLSIEVFDPVRQPRQGGRVPLLRTTNGLTGKFHTVQIPWGKVDYDVNGAYLVW